jgi:signal transduction histidine kinase
MNDPLADIEQSGLQFFGKMTASVSHEIKNVLAIINENAGLLEDFALMAEGGAAIEPQRLKTLSHAVMKQVERADTIVKILNRFAHSTDASLQTVDLNDLMQLLAALSNRFAAMRSITLNLKPNQSATAVRTAPFLLMNLLWLCLDFAFDMAGDGQVVELATRKTEAGVQVSFKPIGGAAPVALPPFPAEHEQRLLAWLNAELQVGVENREVRVKLPPDIARR